MGMSQGSFNKNQKSSQSAVNIHTTERMIGVKNSRVHENISHHEEPFKEI
jgi:hypothetical protein